MKPESTAGPDELREALHARQAARATREEHEGALRHALDLARPRFREWATGESPAPVDPIAVLDAEAQLPALRLAHARASRAEREAIRRHEMLAQGEAEHVATAARERLKPVFARLASAWAMVEQLAAEADAIAVEGHTAVTAALDGTGLAVPGALALSVGSSQVWRAQGTVYLNALTALLDPPSPPVGPPPGHVLVKALRGFSVDHRGDLLDNNNSRLTDEALGALLDNGPRINRGEVCTVSQRAAALLVARRFAELVED